MTSISNPTNLAGSSNKTATPAPGTGTGSPVAPDILGRKSGTLTARDLEESTGALPVLGYSTQWNLSQVEIGHTDLLMALRSRGFLAVDPERPSPTVALRRAIFRWVQDKALAVLPPGRPSTNRTLWSEQDDSSGNDGGLGEEWNFVPGLESDGPEDNYPEEPEGESNGAVEGEGPATGAYPRAGTGQQSKGGKGKGQGKGQGKGKSRNRARKSLLRKINSAQSDWLVFGLVIEQLDLDALGLSYATRLRVFLHKKTLEIKVSRAESGFEAVSAGHSEVNSADSPNSAISTGQGQESDPEPELAGITTEICQLFYYYREHHQARDISMLLKQLVGSLDSFSLRRLGGVYFVPQQHQAALEDLKKLVEDLPAAAGHQSDKFMLKLPILDGAGAKKQLAQAAYRDFLMELAGMQADLDHLAEEAAHRQLRSDTVSRRLTTYRELKARAEVYADLLDMQQGRILSAVDRLSTQAGLLLDSLTDHSLQTAGEQQTFDWDNLEPETATLIAAAADPGFPVGTGMNESAEDTVKAAAPAPAPAAAVVA